MATPALSSLSVSLSAFCRWAHLCQIPCISDVMSICLPLSDLFCFVWYIWVRLCCCKWHYFLLFNGWVILHCVCVCVCVCVCTHTHRTFFIHSSVDGCVRCFHALVFVNGAAANTGEHGPLWTLLLPGHVPRSGIAVSSGIWYYFMSSLPLFCVSGTEPSFLFWHFCCMQVFTYLESLSA